MISGRYQAGCEGCKVGTGNLCKSPDTCLQECGGSTSIAEGLDSIQVIAEAKASNNVHAQTEQSLVDVDWLGLALGMQHMHQVAANLSNICKSLSALPLIISSKLSRQATRAYGNRPRCDMPCL